LDVETHVVDAFVQLTMKLNENLFKPLFLKVVDWASISHSELPTDDESQARMTLFYHLLDTLSSKLKSILIPYFGYVLDNSILCLNNFAESGANEQDEIQKDDFFTVEEEEEETATSSSSTTNKLQLRLIRYLLSSLRQCFLYDSEGFINKDKFDKLLHPLVNQLENLSGGDAEYKARMTDYLIPCLSQLAICVGTDVSAPFFHPIKRN
jgi:hypothetical protein